MTTDQQTLANIKAGDEVAIRIGMSDSYSIYPVKSIGPKGIIELSTGGKYRPDGSPIEKDRKWGRPGAIEPVTDEIRLTIRKNALVGELARLDYNAWKQMDVSTLEAIARLVRLDARAVSE